MTEIGERPIGGNVLDFQSLRRRGLYRDKTDFIGHWWRRSSFSTLVLHRPGTGKSVMAQAVRSFFSLEEKNQEALFSGLKVWEDADLRSAAGRYPVIFLDWSGIRGGTAEVVSEQLFASVHELWQHHQWLLGSDRLSEWDQRAVEKYLSENVDRSAFIFSIETLCGYVNRAIGVQPMVVLDGYDVPLWSVSCEDEAETIAMMLESFLIRTFKANFHLKRGLVFGWTQFATGSWVADWDNADVADVTSGCYAESFSERFSKDSVGSRLIDRWVWQMLRESPDIAHALARLIAGKSVNLCPNEPLIVKTAASQLESFWKLLLNFGCLDIRKNDGVCCEAVVAGEEEKEQLKQWLNS